MLQIQKARDLNITEDIYYEIIRQKTATLLASCCAIGAKAVNSDSRNVNKMNKFGQLIGMAFQIKDDLFDYGERKIGKPLGVDIKEKKMTLPLIYTLNTSNSSEKRQIINTVKNHSKNKEMVRDLIDLVIKKGGLDFAKSKMDWYYKQAMKILLGFPKNEYRDSLELMSKYVIERKI